MQSHLSPSDPSKLFFTQQSKSDSCGSITLYLSPLCPPTPTPHAPTPPPCSLDKTFISKQGRVKSKLLNKANKVLRDLVPAYHSISFLSPPLSQCVIQSPDAEGTMLCNSYLSWGVNGTFFRELS